MYIELDFRSACGGRVARGGDGERGVERDGALLGLDARGEQRRRHLCSGPNRSLGRNLSRSHYMAIILNTIKAQ